MDVKTLREWRRAHPELYVSDDALSAFEDFPSLRANDTAPAAGEFSQFIKDLYAETQWAYHLAQKAQSQSNASDLLGSMLNEVRTTDPQVARFIMDYAKANNIQVI